MTSHEIKEIPGAVTPGKTTLNFAAADELRTGGINDE